jgi:ABC-type bacteriocin/lantibiotic exporter with double-glycine peptidase domain
MNAEGKARTRFHEINDDYRNANIETIYYYSVFYPLVDFIGTVGIALVIAAFGYEYLTTVSAAGDALKIGLLASFIQYSLQLFQPIRDLSDKFNVLQAAIVASHRIFILLDLDIDIKSPENPKKTGKAVGEIEFRNVWFAYKENDWVLKDVSFKMNLGESVALVGATGSGKTTVTNLLMRFYDVQQGSILLDGVDVVLRFPRRAQGAVGGEDAEIGRALAVIDVAPFFHPAAGADPLVGRVHDPRERFIPDDVLRDADAAAGNDRSHARRSLPRERRHGMFSC